MNVTEIWETLNHCEQLSFLHQIGKFILNTYDLNSTQTAEMNLTLWNVLMAMIDSGCWV